MKKLIGVLGWCVTLVSCALEPSYRAQQIRPAYPEMVTECVFLGGVTGTSDLLYSDLGKQKAKYLALDEAAKLGGTHIVWTELSQSAQPTAQGRVYRCSDF